MRLRKRTSSDWPVASAICFGLLVLCLAAAPARADDYADNGPSNGQGAALSDILSLPPGDVVPALVRALRNEPMFRHPDWKHRGYSVLLSMNGVAYTTGVRQFIRGLDDPVVSCLCVYALGTVGPERSALAVPALTDYLERMMAGQPVACADTNMLFEAIAAHGRDARALGSRLESVVTDTTRPVAMRGQAARTLVRVGGIVNFIGVTEAVMKSDSIGGRLALNSLLLEGEKEHWSFIPASSEVRKSMSALMDHLLDVRPERSYLERVKLGSDAPQVLAESALLKERIDVGSLIIESIGRFQPRYAGGLMMIWIEELRATAKQDPSMSVRLLARTKLVRAEQRIAYFGTR
jgi:hypothetical protein